MIAEYIQPNNTTVESKIIKNNDNDPQIWKKNKQKMIEILKSAPVTGVYKNEKPESWETFFQFYIDFLNAQNGPRGECAKKIRQDLKQNKDIVDDVLKPYNLNHQMHIRSIYIKFKYFVPCKQYHQRGQVVEALQKCKQNLTRLKQPQHPMYISIRDGLLKKHGPQYSYSQQIAQLQKTNEDKIQLLQKQKIYIDQKLNSSIQYQNYIKMNNVMKKWYNQWIQADSGVGKDSCNRGQLFQDKVLYNAIPYIMKRERQNLFKHIKQDQLFTDQNIQKLILQANQNSKKKYRFNRLHIFVNSRWNPRSLGQIDITIAQYIQQTKTYEALVLVQCKARLFDIRQASYQVFPQYLKAENKIQLSSKYGPVYRSDKIVSYIVTTLPDFQFSLPIESELKSHLDRNSKDKPIEQIKQQIMSKIIFQECQKRFRNQLSPLEWMKLNDSQNVIVLSSQTL